jgi:hypothetical protein
MKSVLPGAAGENEQSLLHVAAESCPVFFCAERGEVGKTVNYFSKIHQIFIDFCPIMC